MTKLDSAEAVLEAMGQGHANERPSSGYENACIHYDHGCEGCLAYRATAERIAQAMRVLEAWEQVDGDVYDALQEGKCNEYALETLRAALEEKDEP